MFTLGQEKFIEEASKPQPIMFTAGAVPVVNEKGEVSMQKVKVKRYVAGKRPDWADDEYENESDEERNQMKDEIEDESEEEDEIALAIKMQKSEVETQDSENIEKEIKNSDDRRLRRLMDRSSKEDDEIVDHSQRRRHFEPEVISEGEESEEDRNIVQEEIPFVIPPDEDASDDDEEELNEDEIESRRQRLRQRVMEKQNDEELLAQLPDEEEERNEATNLKTISDEEEYTSESEYSDSEDEGPRLKPVFIRKKDRLTIKEKEEEEEKQRQLEMQAKKQAEERKRYAAKLVEIEMRRELEEKVANKSSADLIDSDDGNDEEEYETWKLRELKRIKRDRDERETRLKERDEVERLRNMTEEERRNELYNNPKELTNKGVKGKYKFLQKYYHRGAFFMDEEENVFNRDYAQPTLEDHFDKTSLPQVMQVKNFGRSGRTKYTHLRDQDTTPYDSWNEENTLATKFMMNRAGGMKQSFTKPSRKKK